MLNTFCSDLQRSMLRHILLRLILFPCRRNGCFLCEDFKSGHKTAYCAQKQQSLQKNQTIFLQGLLQLCICYLLNIQQDTSEMPARHQRNIGNKPTDTGRISLPERAAVSAGPGQGSLCLHQSPCRILLQRSSGRCR